jgi:hypothetical protein
VGGVNVARLASRRQPVLRRGAVARGDIKLGARSRVTARVIQAFRVGLVHHRRARLGPGLARRAIAGLQVDERGSGRRGAAIGVQAQAVGRHHAVRVDILELALAAAAALVDGHRLANGRVPAEAVAGVHAQ